MSLDPTIESGLVPVSSEELLARFEHDGDPVAFAEIVARHLPSVHAICRKTTGNQHDAEDAAQSSFLALALQARGGNGIGKVGAWMSQVAKRTSLDLVRSRGRRQKREARLCTEQTRVSSSPEQELMLLELRQLLTDEISKLAPRYRLPVVMHYFDGLDTVEVSKKLGCTPGTLTVRLHRARKLLGQKLKKRGIQGGFYGVYSTIKSKLGETAQRLVGTETQSRPAAQWSIVQLIARRMQSMGMALARPFGFHGGRNQLRWTAGMLCLVGAALADTPSFIRRPAANIPPTGSSGMFRGLAKQITDSISRFQNILKTGLTSANTNPSDRNALPLAVPYMPAPYPVNTLAKGWNVTGDMLWSTQTLTGSTGYGSAGADATATRYAATSTGALTSNSSVAANYSSAIPQYQIPAPNNPHALLFSSNLAMANGQSAATGDWGLSDTLRVSDTSSITTIGTEIFPGDPTPTDIRTLDPINGVSIPEPTTGIVLIGAAWVMMSRRKRRKISPPTSEI